VFATRLPPRSTEVELAAFDTVCERLEGFDRGLSFEIIDGFLTALAATPRLPPAGEWLPALCGDAFERAFADPDDQAQARAALQARLRVLCAQLDPEALLDEPDFIRLEPLIGEYTDEDRARLRTEADLSEEDVLLYQTGVWWAEGFFDAIGHFPALWALPADEAAPALFKQAFDQIEALRAHGGSDEWKAHVATYYPKGDPTRDELIAEACMAVQDLRLLWVDFAPRPETRRVAQAPGRNDPCPCGSGKKFKKCHGA
jgi:uncharacterized protein